MAYLQTFLTAPDARKQWRVWAHLPSADDDILDRWATRLSADVPLTTLLADGEAALFDGNGSLDDWLMSGDTDGETAAGLYALLGLLSLPRLHTVHQGGDVDDAISHGVGFDVGIAVERYRRVRGAQTWGAERWLLDWWRLVASGDLYRIGRLEYHLRPYNGVAVAFRHGQSGAVVALSGDGILYDGDGYAVTDAANPPPGTWEATLHEDEDGNTGYILPPTGLAIRQQVHLPHAEWAKVLRPGDLLLDVHIPAGSPLDADTSRASFRDALAFFTVRFPTTPIRGFTCRSWLLDPAWQARLQTGRLADWARQPYLFPVESGSYDGLYFVFARHRISPEQTDATTRLEVLMRDAVASGEPLRSGAMFLLADEMDRWGQQPYRSNWPMIQSLLSL